LRRVVLDSGPHGIDDLYAMVEKRLHRHLVWLGFPFRRVARPH
jgi:hypothetical protein